jgi:hypothetical protein
MTLKYILRSFRRRKVRMIIILLSIIFGAGMVVSLGAYVSRLNDFAEKENLT